MIYKDTKPSAPAESGGSGFKRIPRPSIEKAVQAFAPGKDAETKKMKKICGCGDPDCDIGPFTREVPA